MLHCDVDCASEPDIGAAVQKCLLEHYNLYGVSKLWSVTVKLSGDACDVSTLYVDVDTTILYDGPATLVGSGLRLPSTPVEFTNLKFDGKNTTAPLLEHSDISAALGFNDVTITGFVGEYVLHVTAKPEDSVRFSACDLRIESACSGAALALEHIDRVELRNVKTQRCKYGMWLDDDSSQALERYYRKEYDD